MFGPTKRTKRTPNVLYIRFLSQQYDKLFPESRKTDPKWFGPKGNLSQRKTDPIWFGPKGNLSQRKTDPKLFRPKGNLSQRKFVPKENCPKGNLPQRKFAWFPPPGLVQSICSICFATMQMWLKACKTLWLKISPASLSSTARLNNHKRWVSTKNIPS